MNIKNAVCIIAYLPVVLVVLDNVVITQFKRPISHVPIREVTALRCDVWINLIRHFQVKYDFAEIATKTVENST